MRRVLALSGTWRLSEGLRGEAVKSSAEIDVDVPGEVHVALSKAGRLPADLFQGLNLKDAQWVEERYWTYRKTFRFDGEMKARTNLVFDGLDLFATVWLNGTRLGETDNMFLRYRFDVSALIRQGDNEIVVEFQPIKPRVAELHEKYPKYRAIFYPGRSLVRKAQCQFGWDWAPAALSIGIWGDAYIETFDPATIEETHADAELDGEVCFRILLADSIKDKRLRVTVNDGASRIVAEAPTLGVNNFVNLKIDQPKLWWPVGLGEQHLYDYSVELLEAADDTVLDTRRGRFGIRKTEIRERIVETDRMGFTLYVNDTPVFCKGANWTPADGFPGVATSETYDYLVRRAREANFNILRVWGGGVYEKDAFYDECDRQGIMVWQDFMNACAEVPDDQAWFLDTAIKEAEYQVRRLRAHPSVVVWCGGNESSSSHAYQPDRAGKRLTSFYYRGLVADLSRATAYISSSPHSKHDVGQTQTSGETHWSSWPRLLETQYGDFRQRIAESRTVFNSEICLQGPSPLPSMLRFASEGDIWPPNEVMDFHVVCHPGNPKVHPRYVISQLKMAEQIVGPCHGARSFVNNAMMGHAEMVRSDLEFYRAQKFANSGALLWMYNEPWPCANWAVVDYYGYLKAAYWAARRTFAPLAVAVMAPQDTCDVYLMNDTLRDAGGELTLRQLTLDGETLWERRASGSCPANAAARALSIPRGDVRELAGSFLRAVWRVDGEGEGRAVNYFLELPKDVAFPRPDARLEFVEKNRPIRGVGAGSAMADFASKVRVSSRNYARYLHIEFPELDVREITLSDDYFDLIPGEEKLITIESARPVGECRLESLLDR